MSPLSYECLALIWEEGWVQEPPHLESWLKSLFMHFVALHGWQYVPIKLKFGMDEYTMGSLSYAKLGVGCSWPACWFCSNSTMLVSSLGSILS